jgi:hypothetical protein
MTDSKVAKFPRPHHSVVGSNTEQFSVLVKELNIGEIATRIVETAFHIEADGDSNGGANDLWLGWLGQVACHKLNYTKQA